MAYFKGFKTVSPPEHTVARITRREHAKLILDIIDNPQRFLNQVKLYVAVEVRNWRGQSCRKYVEAKVVGFNKVDTMDTCRVDFLGQGMIPTRTIKVVGILATLDHWYYKYQNHEIAMRRRDDTLFPSAGFNL